jgi:hypothetical protein
MTRQTTSTVTTAMKTSTNSLPSSIHSITTTMITTTFAHLPATTMLEVPVITRAKITTKCLLFHTSVCTRPVEFSLKDSDNDLGSCVQQDKNSARCKICNKITVKF